MTHLKFITQKKVIEKQNFLNALKCVAYFAKQEINLNKDSH